MADKKRFIEMLGKPWQDYAKEDRVAVFENRIALTVAQRDSDDLPRVSNAGETMVDENGYAVQIMHNGLKVLYARYYGAWVNEIIRQLKGVHEPQQEMIFDTILKRLSPGAAMIEAGAYWCYYSMWFARAIPQGRSLMIEPNSKHLEIGKKNFEINGLTGDFTFGYFGEFPEKKVIHQREQFGIDLKRYELPEFMAEKGLDRLELLHADIQGGETEMLDGARALLDRRLIDYMVISTHGREHQRCLDIVTGAGYVIAAEHDVDKVAKADGMIIAHSPEVAPLPKFDITGISADPAEA